MVYITDEIRLIRCDKYNIQIECYEDVLNKTTGTVTKMWKGCGYYGTLQSALKGVLKIMELNMVSENPQKSGAKEIIEYLTSVQKTIITAINNIPNTQVLSQIEKQTSISEEE